VALGEKERKCEAERSSPTTLHASLRRFGGIVALGEIARQPNDPLGAASRRWAKKREIAKLSAPAQRPCSSTSPKSELDSQIAT